MCARCFTMTVCFSLMLNCGNNIDATDNCCIKCPKNLSKIGSSGQHDYKMMSYLSHEEEFNSGGINYYKANHHLQFQSACKSAYASDVITACRLSNLYNFNVLLVCDILGHHLECQSINLLQKLWKDTVHIMHPALCVHVMFILCTSLKS